MNSEGRMSWPQVEQRLKNIAVDLLGVDRDTFSLEDDWERDVKADSLDIVEYIMACEEAFGIEVRDETLSNTRSVADAIRAFVRENPRVTFDIVDSRLLALQIRPDGYIEVSLQLEDGSWVFADGSGRLPSKVYVTASGSWASILQELEDMINDPDIDEQDLQEYLERHPELLAGDDYDRVVPQAFISRNDQVPWRADFVLAPVNQTEFAKVIDLKLPRERLTLRPVSGHVSFSAKLHHSIEQLRDYGRAFDDEDVRERFHERYGIDIYKPDLQLIIGRRWDLEWIDNIRSLRKETEVAIETWDDLIERIRRRVA